MTISNRRFQNNSKMLLKEDFRKLLVLCLKMLFRKSTRKRFVCLVIAFLFMMGFNTRSYVKKFHTAETLKKRILDEKAFKVFFLRMRTRNNFARFFNQHYNTLRQFGAAIVKKAFIYQNNLFIHFFAPSESKDQEKDQGKNAMRLLYSVFNIEKFAADFFVDTGDGSHQTAVRDNYIDHNGAGLSKEIIAARHATLKFDLIDMADMIREKIWDKRTEVYNTIKKTIISNMKRIAPKAAYAPNPYLSRVESIVPMNYLHILTNIKYDNTTDVVDLAESVSYEADATIKTDKAYLAVPAIYKDTVMYQDIDAYPRYTPLYIPDLMRPQWNWLLFQNIAIKTDFMDYIDQLHFQGHYLFSYEKSHILKDKVQKINDAIISDIGDTDGLLDLWTNTFLLQGPVSGSITNTSITILGVTFSTDASTEFENLLEQPISSSEFYGFLDIGTLVKLKDDSVPGDGIADEASLED